MTQQRDIKGLLDLWLAEGSTVAPDRVIDVITDRIERQRQRGAWRFPRREFHVPAVIRLAAVAAAIAIVGAGAIYFAGSARPSTAPSSPGPTDSVAPSPAPSPSPYVLRSGLPYRSPGPVSWTAFTPGVRMDAPYGWFPDGSSVSFSLALGLVRTAEGDSGSIGGSILVRPHPVLGNVASCAETRTAAPTEGPAMPASAIAAALLVDPRFAVTTQPDIAIDGWRAQVLDIQLAPGFGGTCGDGVPSARLFDSPGSFVVLARDQRARLIVLDADRVPFVILVYPVEEAFDAFVARSMPLITEMTFLP